VILAEALGLLLPHLEGALRVHANGFISRTAHAARDGDRCFYMIGSMGLASSIGLGLALARPRERVVVLDGDGNLLMNLGALAAIAALGPPNLRHVCFDNGVHASTGAQRTISDRVPLEEVARAAGYRWNGRVDSQQTLAEMAPAFFAAAGPAFLLVRIALDPPGAPAPRIPHTPEVMTARLRHALGVDG
jgi:thiamine pyrophosphate-dependent acetolactate synthase large subunit-like protein